jgi:hypothetical protein
MQQKILNFIKYNNAFSIILGVIFLGGSVTFAASPTARESVYSSKETVVSVDNTLIVGTDLSNFNFNLRINSVTEDSKNYYAAYSYQTLAIENDVWQIKQADKVLIVSKEYLDGRDLGLYIAKELGDSVNYELSYLKRTQELEKGKGETQKIVATQYSGLIGKMLNPKEEVIEGYSPVVVEPVPQTAAVAESKPTAIIVSKPVDSSTPSSANIIDQQKVQEVVQQELQSGAGSTPDSTSSPQATPITPLPVEPSPEITPPPTPAETPAEPPPAPAAEPAQ